MGNSDKIFWLACTECVNQDEIICKRQINFENKKKLEKNKLSVRTVTKRKNTSFLKEKREFEGRDLDSKAGVMIFILSKKLFLWKMRVWIWCKKFSFHYHYFWWK